MPELMKHGQCLCGRIKIRAQIDHQKVDVCHCGMCRTWGGGPLMGIHAEERNVEIEGREQVSVFSSSDWAERGFCRRCGTHLFYRTKDGRYFDIPAGLLQPAEGLSLNTQIFIDRKPEFYNFAEQTQTMTEAEVFAKFTPEQ